LLQTTQIDLSAISTPKLGPSDPSRSFYKYYAGYSEAFVEDTLRFLGATRGQRILDPWNGAGTTTAVAASRELEAYGYDLNPALVVIAKARTAKPGLGQESLNLLCERLGRERRVEVALDECDPLLRWFGTQSVLVIRRIEKLFRSQIDAGKPRTTSVNSMSDELALFYSITFRVLRLAAARQFGSNPTWIRHGVAGRRSSLSMDTFRRAFISEAKLALDYFKSRMDCEAYECPTVKIGSSVELRGLKAGTIDLTITSPPYCTRIDYAIATSIELAMLSRNYPMDFSRLRRGLIGTTITSGSNVLASSEWGRSCNEFLVGVKAHASKASATYYFRYYANYFRQIFESLERLTAAAKGNGFAVIVVQDSYYKDIRLNLDAVISEMLFHYGWTLQYKRSFVVGVSFTHLNPHGKLYHKASAPIENALFFRR
jgi:SAM-dependent methyltransferase